MNYLIIVFYTLAFLATILSILGNPRNEKIRGIGSITKIGRALFVVALLSFVSSIYIAIDEAKVSKQKEQQLNSSLEKIGNQEKLINSLQKIVENDLNTTLINHIAIDVPNYIFRFSTHAGIDIGSMTLELATVGGGAYINNETFVELHKGQKLWAGLGQYNAVTNFSDSLKFNSKKCYGLYKGTEKELNSHCRIHIEISVLGNVETTLPNIIEINFEYFDIRQTELLKLISDITPMGHLKGWPYYIIINKNRYYILDDSLIKKDAMKYDDDGFFTLTYRSDIE